MAIRRPAHSSGAAPKAVGDTAHTTAPRKRARGAAPKSDPAELHAGSEAEAGAAVGDEPAPVEPPDPTKAAPSEAAVPAKDPSVAQPASPAAPASPRLKLKLVRDSFTMPQADFALIQLLKDRALESRRPAKKSELLRAGLHTLATLDAAQLVQALESLEPLKAGRPRKQP